MDRLIVKIALVSVSATLGLLAAEGYCRIEVANGNEKLIRTALAEQVPIPTDSKIYFKHLVRLNENPQIIYELKPNIQGVNYLGAELSTNQFGFRGPELSLEKPKNTIRVLGIGDSVMFGQGVLDEETYFRRLERELDARFPDKEWEFINTGVPGYNTVLEVETLLAKGLPLDIDAVFLGVVQNDFELPNFTQEFRDPWTVSRLYLPEFVRGGDSKGGAANQGTPGLQGRDMKKGRGVLSDPSAQPEHLRGLLGHAAFRNAMENLAELCEVRGLPVMTFSYKFSRDCARMIEVSEDLGFFTISSHELLEAYLAERKIDTVEDFNLSDMVLSYEDHHPSAKHHGLIAGWILDDLGGAEWFHQLALK